MERIIIIGGNGSGKTTFSLELAKKLEIPVIHLDQIFWKGNWENRSNNEFDNLLIRELKKPKWIIDGNYNRTLPIRIKYSDTIFYFDFSTIYCIWSITIRIIKNYGKSRFDMGGNCPERFDMNFYKNVILFNKKYRKQQYQILQENKDKNIIIFNNRNQVKKYLQQL